MMIEGNRSLDSTVRMISKEDGICLELPAIPDDRKLRSVVTSALLGSTVVSAQPYEQPDGSPYRIDTDYFGNKRKGRNPAPGPFEKWGEKKRTLKAWPKHVK